MSRMFRYGIACTLEEVSRQAPIILRGEIEDIAATAKALGYDAIELQLRDPQRFDAKRLLTVAKQTGIAYCAIATGREYVENGLSVISEDAGIRRAAIDAMKRHVDLGAELGCMVIVGTVRGKIPDFSRYDHYEGMLTEAKLEIAEYASPKGVVILVENILSSISNYLCTMRQVMDYVQKLGRENIAVHLDTYSMLMEENDIPGAVSYCAPKLKYVHFSDSGRYYPGGGNVNFRAFLNALRDVGYDGYITLECIPYPGEFQCAKLGIEYLTALETCVRIERSMNHCRKSEHCL